MKTAKKVAAKKAKKVTRKVATKPKATVTVEKPKFNIYEMVTNRIVEGLKGNVIPWEQPWMALGDGPRNASTGKYYRGVNVFILGWEARCHGYESNLWLTYKQVESLGGKVKKGSKATPIVFWDIYFKTEKDPTTGKEEETKRFLLRYYNVFNVAQCEELTLPALVKEPPLFEEGTPCEKAELIWKGWVGRPDLKHGGDQASYSPLTDTIRMPKKGQFRTPELYYSTFFHEITHATGSSKRLNRLSMKNFYDQVEYAKEELVAELGAAFFMNLCGIETPRTQEQTVAYCAGWIKRLTNDPQLLIQASGAAQRAVELVVEGGKAKKESEGSDEDVPLALAA